MQTKGVDSVRSPVKNLRQFGSSGEISRLLLQLSIQHVRESSYIHVSQIQKVREQLQVIRISNYLVRKIH